MSDKQPFHNQPRSFDEILDEIVYDRNAMEVTFTDQRRVACMGSGGALGHPRVFYTIGDKGYAECMYCDRVFVLDPARAGQVYDPGTDERTEEGERNRQQTIEERPGDGLTESATPPPGETLESGHDTVSSPRRR
ncbi:zinc-finger domain-containing protein [Parvularcula dongshanensis]|uniref:Putative Zn-finger protein n=1 Tax=Parvularcula dongshanensis TaxID=1173995 RepID=A0A840I120_9PROT|nr:zinc-finger domain-containing protein [Parvularcula dongshanensis]MBB4657981.1 putative Zn-finger protein [Parvularcula dongshanensis]